MKVQPNSPSTVFASSVFGLTAWTAALMFLAAFLIAALLFWRTNDLLISQVVTSLEAEAADLGRDYQSNGLSRVSETIARRAQGPGPGLYYMQNASGRRVAGNLPGLPDAISGNKKGGVFNYRVLSHNGSIEERSGVAIRVNFAGGAYVLVGRDIQETEDYVRWVRALFLAGFGALAIAAIAASVAVSRMVLGRISGINKTAHAIMDGDLSRRIPLSGFNDELDDLSRNLNSMLDRIGHLMSSLREVSDNIAHDLKTPLNRLRNHAEGALRDRRGSDAYREGLERTIEEADGLIRTFNALLLIARLEAGAVEKTAVSFDLAGLVRDVSELYEPVAEQNGLKLEIKSEGAIPVRANKQLIGQAVANLIDNAIKYGRQGKAGNGAVAEGVIGIKTVAFQGQAELEVSDHGPGISAADRTRVLNRFVRLERSRTQPGTGLGLSLVAAVAQMHGGSLDLEDNDPGLRVRFQLPLDAGASEQVIADDEPAMAKPEAS